jgi:hypothetical protein
MDTNEKHPIDASVFEASLSSEIVTYGEVEAMLDAAKEILAVDSEISNVNGLPAIVSRQAAEVEISGKTYYARVFQLTLHDAQKEPELPAIGFDETPDVAILTSNPFAFRFKEFGEHGYVLETDGNIDVTVNNPEHVRVAKRILNELGMKEIAVEEQKRQAETEAKAAEEHAKQQRKQERHNSRAYAWERAKEWGGNIVATVAVIGALAAAGFGVVKGVSALQPENYDDRTDVHLDGGTEIPMGQSGIPEFSRELYNNPPLSRDTMPIIEPSGSEDIVLEMHDKLRQVIIKGSQESNHCQEIKIEHVPLGTTLVAWTDAVDANGNSRASEFQVDNEVDKFRVCWNGQERDKDDDPRVVVALRAAADSKPR